MVERQAQDNEVPTGVNKNWNDPLPKTSLEYDVSISYNYILY